MEFLKRNKFDSTGLLIFWIHNFLSLICGCGGLRDVGLMAPVAVPEGGTATLRCTYNLEGEPLYTVKWYKGRQEFFRYVPKEHPNTTVFPLPGVNVDLNASGKDKVVLRDVQRDMASKYRCEVSTDFPDFHTEVVSAKMNVISAMEGQPTMILEKATYSKGDTLKGNCSSPPSNPLANVTWFVNGKMVNASNVIYSEDLNVTTAELKLNLSSFPGHALQIRCVADIYSIYSTHREVTVIEDKSTFVSVMGTLKACINRAPGDIHKLSNWSFLTSLLMITYSR